MYPLRILFYGTSAFSVPTLEQLAQDARLTIVGVVTQPDRPSGRHAQVLASPIKQLAQRMRLPVKQYPSVKDAAVYDELALFQPDIAVVVSFGQIIPERLLSLPKHGSINIHGSLLPAYRGSSPVNAAILHGDGETGITIMQMDAKMDHGPIIKQFPEKIHPDDTAQTLHDRLALLGGKHIVDTLIAYVEGRITPLAQEESQATYVKLLSREDGAMSEDKPATFIERQVRAYHPWPGTYGFFGGQRLKILAAQVIELPMEYKNAPKGTTFIAQGLPAIVCGEGTALTFNRLQPEGRKAMEGKDFLHGKNLWGQPLTPSG